MDVRHVQETGGGTLFISLPKPWAKRHNLSRNTIVYVVERGDGSLVVNSQYDSEKNIKVGHIGLSPYLEQEIVGKYLQGYDALEIESKDRISPLQREQVKTIFNRLIGLEIVEETANKIVLQFLLEPSAFLPQKILHREFLISSGMLKDALSAFIEKDINLAKNVVERDDEVDRLYFLLVRTLRQALLLPDLWEKKGLPLIDCLDYRLFASFIEATSDRTTEFTQDVMKVGDISMPSSLSQKIFELGELSHNMYETAASSFLSRSFDISRDVLKQHQSAFDVIQELDQIVLNQPLNVASFASSLIVSLRKICDYSVDIADLVMPK